MEGESIFRWAFVAILMAMFVVSGSFRRRARASGEAIPRAREGGQVMLARALFAAPLYLSILAYAINPGWMAWSSLSLPAWARWLAALVAAAAIGVLVWVFRSIGSNISETFLTKEKHQLVTHGPYRWVRHPLYSTATLSLIALSLLAANWFILGMAVIAFVAIATLVVPREEAALIEKFGDEYRAYQRRSGRFLPRFGANT